MTTTKPASPEAGKPAEAQTTSAEPPKAGTPKVPDSHPDGPSVVEEQRARSAEYEKGHYPPDERGRETTPQQVPGVAPPTKRG